MGYLHNLKVSLSEYILITKAETGNLSVEKAGRHYLHQVIKVNIISNKIH